MNENTLRYFRFDVCLQDVEPAVWRLIEVPDSYSFWDLHVAIQDAFGWLDCHLHCFVTADLDKPVGIQLDADDDEYLPGWEIPLLDVFARPGDVCRYDYDFGDGWSHEVKLMTIASFERGVEYPRCVGGERACPPEDCGGPPGYEHLLNVLGDQHHEEHDDMVNWLKSHARNYYPFDPAAFDASNITFWNPEDRLQIMLGQAQH